MALAITQAVAPIAGTANQDSYSFAAFTPAANSLLYVVGQISGSSLSWTVADTSGLTWTRIDETPGALSNEAHWRAQVGDTPVEITITLTVGEGDTASGCNATCSQVTGHNAVSPIVQSTTDGTGASGTQPQMTFPAALGAGNAYFGAVVMFTDLGATPQLAPPSGWTELSETGFSSPPRGMEAAFRVGGETGATITWAAPVSASSSWRSIGVEIAAAPPLTFAAGALAATGHALAAALGAELAAGDLTIGGRALDAATAATLATAALDLAGAGLEATEHTLAALVAGVLTLRGWDVEAGGDADLVTITRAVARAIARAAAGSPFRRFE